MHVILKLRLFAKWKTILGRKYEMGPSLDSDLRHENNEHPRQVKVFYKDHEAIANSFRVRMI